MTIIAGSLVVEEVAVAGGGVGTAATLTLTHLDSGDPPIVLPAVSGDGGATWSVSVTYDDPGIWIRRWVATGPGAGTREDTVAVAPAVTDLGDDARAYATTADLARYTGEAPPVDAGRLLARASELIDSMLLSARYPVDDDGMPTDEVHIDALRKATCQQVKWWVDTGDPTGVGATFQSVSIAGVSLSRGYTSKGSATGAAARMAPDVWSTLALAGLTGHAPAVVS